MNEFPRWQFCTRQDIHDKDGLLYLRRYRLLQTPWFGIYLHKLVKPDPDRDLHDHPWAFLSLVLKGGYKERRLEKTVLSSDSAFNINVVRDEVRPWLSLAFRKATDAHRIVELKKSPTWTLVLVGPKVRSWGFHTAHGWVHWARYIETR